MELIVGFEVDILLTCFYVHFVVDEMTSVTNT